MIDGLFDVYGKERPPDLVTGALHAHFLHCKAVLEGREPPKAVPGETAESNALVELAQHIARLDEAPRTVGETLIRRHLSKMRVEQAQRRRQQRIRHEAALRRGQSSPIEVWRFVAEHAALTGSTRGSPAAAARDLRKSPARISKLLQVAEQNRRKLEWMRDVLLSIQEALDAADTGALDGIFIAGDFDEVSGLRVARREAARLRADIEQLLRKMPPL